MNFSEYCKYLEAKIVASYERGVTIEAAEKLAGEFLVAQLKVSDELERVDLDARMKKSGYKAIRASVFLSTIQKEGKKPSDSHLEAIIDADRLVNKERDNLDIAESQRGNLDRYYSVFSNAHIHFRTIAKGKFE